MRGSTDVAHHYRGIAIRVHTANKNLTVRLSCIDSPEMSQKPYSLAFRRSFSKVAKTGTMGAD
jgi:endonuclease YncB( thermonuclease family)